MKKYLAILILVILAGLGIWYGVSHSKPSSQIQPQPQDLLKGYTVDANYKYTLALNKEIAGTKFTIPASLASGTNLSTDSYISIEKIPNTQNCTAGLFLDLSLYNITPKIVKDGNTTYSVASTTGAAAGNRYEETVYAIPGSNPCTAVRYFIHYGVFQNYPEGTVKEFDKQALLKQFDDIRHALVTNR